MGFPKITHDPDAVLDYPLNLKAEGWIPPGDTLASVTMKLADGLVEDRPLELDADNGIATPWLKVESVDTPPGQYLVTYEFETTGGRKDNRSRILVVKER